MGQRWPLFIYTSVFKFLHYDFKTTLQIHDQTKHSFKSNQEPLRGKKLILLEKKNKVVKLTFLVLKVIAKVCPRIYPNLSIQKKFCVRIL